MPHRRRGPVDMFSYFLLLKPSLPDRYLTITMRGLRKPQNSDSVRNDNCIDNLFALHILGCLVITYRFLY